MAFKRTAGGGRGGERAAAAGGLRVVSIARPIMEVASVVIISAIRSTGVRPVRPCELGLLSQNGNRQAIETDLGGIVSTLNVIFSQLAQ